MVLKNAAIRDEAEIEALLVKEPEQIERGFFVITHQRKAKESKRLDILGVDSEGTLTIIELKAHSDVNQLRQALQYYDWVLEQGLDWIRDAYKDRLGKRNIEDRMPQIFLVANDFDQELRTEVKYMREDITVRLFKYIAFEVCGEKEIKLIEENISPLKGIERKPMTKAENIAYIHNNASRKLFVDTISKLIKLDQSIEEKIQDYAIKYWVHGKKICEFWPKKDYFNVGYKTDEVESGWTYMMEISTKKQAGQAWERIKKAYELMNRM